MNAENCDKDIAWGDELDGDAPLCSTPEEVFDQIVDENIPDEDCEIKVYKFLRKKLPSAEELAEDLLSYLYEDLDCVYTSEFADATEPDRKVQDLAIEMAKAIIESYPVSVFSRTVEFRTFSFRVEDFKESGFDEKDLD